MKTTIAEANKVDAQSVEQVDTIVQPVHDVPQDIPLDRALQDIRSDSRRNPQAYLDSVIVWGQGE